MACICHALIVLSSRKYFTLRVVRPHSNSTLVPLKLYVLKMGSRVGKSNSAVLTLSHFCRVVIFL